MNGYSPRQDRLVFVGVVPARRLGRPTKMLTGGGWHARYRRRDPTSLRSLKPHPSTPVARRLNGE